jgi:hypothetical protein
VVKICLNNIQSRRDRDLELEFEAFQNGGTAVIHPVISASLQDKLDCFRNNIPSKIALEDTPRGKIMATLLGRPTVQGIRMKEEDEDDTTDDLRPDEASIHPSIKELNRRQRATAKLFIKLGGLVHQQAPPGTGKTRVAAAIINSMMEILRDAKFLVIACANIPVTKLVEETSEVCGKDRLEEVGEMALFSGIAKDKYAEQIKEIGVHTLKSKVDSEEFQNKLTDNLKKGVLKYLENCEKIPRMTCEREIGKLYNKIEDPRIRYMTAALAANMLEGEGNIMDSEILIVDESTQIQWAVLVYLVSKLPGLKALLLTGDKYQLGVHLQDLPELFREGFGLESVIGQVEISPGTNYTFLTKMYRSHPFLVELISYASYELHKQKLIAARSAEHRSLLTQSNFLLPVQDCPVGLINAYGAHRPDPKSDSLTDDLQTAMALNLVQALINNFGQEFSKRIVVLCMYTYQQEELEEKLSPYGVRSLTVDAYQAQESDVTIIVTTRSRNASASEGKGTNMKFFEEDRRATVALSRAKHALFLIGDLVAISQGQVWKRFIEKALTRTWAVRGQYVTDLLNRTLRRLPSGMLQGKHGEAKDNQFASEWQQQMKQPSTSSGSQTSHFQIKPNEFPSLQGTSQSGANAQQGRDAGSNRRGRGRMGPNGRWLNYGGNPRTQQTGGRRK